ncbi:MAG: ABC-type dipeptide/oligopeptide/nickel transport system permease subunit, partial [Alphaproteobacteria bacterium]
MDTHASLTGIAADTAAQAQSALVQPGMPSRRTFLDFMREQPLGTIGLILIVIMFVAAIFAPHVAPHSPEEIDFAASPA